MLFSWIAIKFPAISKELFCLISFCDYSYSLSLQLLSKEWKKEEKHFLAFAWPFNDDEGTQVDTTLNAEVGTASSSMKRNYWRILPIVSPIVTPLKVHAIKDTYEVVSQYSIMQMVIKATTTAIIALITATTRASTTPTTTYICSDIMIRQKKLDHSICSTFVWFDALKQ